MSSNPHCPQDVDLSLFPKGSRDIKLPRYNDVLSHFRKAGQIAWYRVSPVQGDLGE